MVVVLTYLWPSFLFLFEILMALFKHPKMAHFGPNTTYFTINNGYIQEKGILYLIWNDDYNEIDYRSMQKMSYEEPT